MRVLLVISLCFSLLSSSGQENPILGQWQVFYEGTDVVLDWRIISGNTCQGIYIWRSTNGVDFEEIGHIPGLCGSVSEPIDYVWLDPDPVELSENYYRIELGGQGLSTVKSLFIDKLVQTGALVYPNPASNGSTLIFKVTGNGPNEVRIFNSTGALMLTEQVNTDRISIDAQRLGAGTYLYRLENDSGSISGKFIVL